MPVIMLIADWCSEIGTRLNCPITAATDESTFQILRLSRTTSK